MIKEDILNRERGIIQDSLLAPIEKKNKPFNWPSSSGTLPIKLLNAREKCLRDGMFPKKGGFVLWGSLKSFAKELIL